MTSIFDSKRERDLYQKLRFKWSRKVDVFSQVSCRSVFKHRRIVNLELPPGAINYLLRADLDFVICKKGTGEPLLIIEFDGLTAGFVRDGKFVAGRQVASDPFRPLKIERKLAAAQAVGIPLIVVSPDETAALTNREHSHTILDGIISHHISAPLVYEAVCAAVREAASEEDLQDRVLAAELEAEVQHDPITRNIMQMRSSLPPVGRGGHGLRFLRDRPGYIGMSHHISTGVKMVSGQVQHKILLEHSIYIRDYGFGGPSVFGLALSLGEYCVLAKAHRMVGTDPDRWKRLCAKSPWVSY